MEVLTNLAIVAAIFAAVSGLLWVVRVVFGGTTRNHVWLFVVIAFGVVTWAALVATGVVHESPYQAARTYSYAAIYAVVLIVLWNGARTRRS